MKRIKKISIFLILTILLIPFTIGTVFADDCSDVQNAVNTLEDIDSLFEQMDCENTDDSAVLSECNVLLVRKSGVLETIFKYNDEEICKSIDLSSIIEEHSEECSNELSSSLKEVSDAVMNIFFVSAPFLILIFSSIDFFKVLTGANPEETKRNRSRFIRRVIAFVLLYLTPLLVRWLFSFTPYNINGTNYICASLIDITPKLTTKGASGKYNGYQKNTAGRNGSGSRNGGGSYGASDGSINFHVDCSSYNYQWCTEGDYVVVDTTYPGGIEGFAEMVRENGITQANDGSWGDCCAGFAQAHSCGLQNGTELTESDLGLEHGDNSCNNISGGCSGIWTWNDSTCFYTVEDYMDYIIGNIQAGIPVMTVVTVDTSSSGRHFVTIIGYKADTDGTTTHDLLILDSWDGRIDTFDQSARGTGYQSIIGYDNHPCGAAGAKNGDYELWASANQN